MTTFEKLSPLFIQLFVRPITNLVVRLFCDVEVYGQENLENADHPIILASNHQHEFDPLIIPSLIPMKFLPSPIFFGAVDSRYYAHLPEWRRRLYSPGFFRALGAHQILLKQRSYKKALVNIVRILKNGGTLYYFPEGKMTQDGIIGPARGGITHLVRETGCSVVPIAIDGIWKLGLRDFLFGRPKIGVIIGKPLLAEEILTIFNKRGGDYKSAAAFILNVIQKLKKNSDMRS